MKLKSISVLILIISALIVTSCIDPIVDNQGKAPYDMIIYSPKTGDSVMVGRNVINYYAEDHPEGGGFSQFEVFINGTSFQVFQVGSDGLPPKLYFDLDTTFLGKTVSVYVTAYNKSYAYKISDPVTNLFVTEDRNPPIAPDSLFVSRIGNTAALLLWVDNSLNETGFEIFRSVNTNNNYSKLTTTGKNVISYTDNSLIPNIKYFYKVRAINEYGMSTYTNEAATDGSSATSDAPYDLVAEVMGATRVNLTWKINPITLLNAFEIQRTDQSSPNTWKTIALLEPSRREYLDSTVKASSGYSYRVAAIYSTKKAISNEISIWTSYTDIPAPSNLKATYNGSNRTISLTWKNNSFLIAATHIELRDEFNNFKEIAILDASAQSYTDTVYMQLTQPTSTFRYRIRQKTTETFFTPYTPEATVLVPYLTPVAPSNVTVFEVTEGEKFIINWDYRTDLIDSFFIRVRDQNFSILNTYTATQNNITIDKLDRTKIYFFQILAFKNNVNGEYTVETSFPIFKPRGLSGLLSFSTSNKPIVTLSWQNPPQANSNWISGTRIEVYRRTAGSQSFEKLATLDTNVNSYVDNTVISPTTYEYRLRAINVNTNPVAFSNFTSNFTIFVP